MKAPTKIPRIILICYGTLGLGILEGLLENQDQCHILGVFRWTNRNENKDPPDTDDRKLKQLVKKSQLKDIQCNAANSHEFIKIIETLQPTHIFIGSWGEILKAELINIPGLEIVNCHPSLLPSHRGTNPYASTIRASEVQSGITFHFITEAIDDGPILLQEILEITPEDTGETLRGKCSQQAKKMIPKLLEILSQDKPYDFIKPDYPESYYPKIELADGLIRWDWPPEKIIDNLRGLQPWLDSYAYIDTLIGKHSFLVFKEGTLKTISSNEEAHYKNIKPGTIVKNEGNRLWIRSAALNKLIGLSRFKIYASFFFLPEFYSALIGRLILKPGKQFQLPPPYGN